MEVISHSDAVGAAGPASFVTSLQDDHGRLGGFECELLGAYDESADTCRHLESLQADGRMDAVSRVVRSRRGFRRTLKTLVLGYLPRQRKSNADTKTQKKSHDIDSDSITVSTAADSMSTEVTLHDRNNSTSSCMDPSSENHHHPPHRQVPVSPDASITKDDVILSGFGRLRPKSLISDGVMEMFKVDNAIWDDDGATAMTELSEASSFSSTGDESVTITPMEDYKEVEIPKDHYLAINEDSETSKTDCSSNSLTSKKGREISLMEKRLIETELVTEGDFEFVPDYVSKEVLHLVDTNKMEEDTDEDVSHVKTGIWEITCLDDEGNPKDPYYIVTAVSMDDRVDTKKLRKAVFAGQNNSRRPKLSMAPTDIAEGLAGYRSGTMAPICHTVPMKLYLEESLIHNDMVDTKFRRLNVGSGMFGKCLSISVDRFLAISSANPKGFEICPIIQARKRESK